MNAGKSTMLLQANHNYQERGMSTIIYTSSVDDRYGKKEIVSRIGLKAESNIKKL
jgi:thymidine kinase